MPFIKSTNQYTKTRKTFGRQPLFQDVSAHMLDSIYPDRNLQKEYILRNPVHRVVQASLPQSSHNANTTILVTHDEGVEHTEGGWPRDVHVHNDEHTARYRRRVMHDESYINTVFNVAPSMKHYLNQNNAVEMYETYFDKLSPQEPVEKCSIRIANVFRDKFKRPVSCVQWTNGPNPKIAVAYSTRNHLPIPDKNIPTHCFLWDVTSQTIPANTIIPEYSCWQLACSLVDSEIIVGGLENGTVSVFDIRRGSKCVQSSSIYNSHRGPVTSLLYCHSRSSTEFFTGSPDGQCLWWDSRNLSKPLERLLMSIKNPLEGLPTLSNAEGVCSLEFDRGLPTRFLCGTESGLVINVNKMGREHSDKLASYWDAHVGPVRAVHRSPCTLRMFLSCGDSTVRIWSEEVHTDPIIVNKPYRYEVMDAVWAPLRYSSYMSICAGGWFYFWDLLRIYAEPLATFQVAKTGLTKITPHAEGHSVAIGDNEGSLHLIHLSDTMVMPGARDKALMSQIYERQTRREHILDARLKEIRLKFRAEKEAAPTAAATAAELQTEEPPGEDEALKNTEEEYFKVVSRELILIDHLTPSTTSLL